MTLENEVATATATDATLPAATETAAPVTETTDATPDWETAADSDLKAIFQKHNPERDASGKFAARAQTDTPVTETTDQAQTQPPEQQKPAAIEPPVSWSAEMKAVFPSLPPAAQEFIAKRESEAAAKITQQGQELSQLQPIGSVVEHYREAFERNGLAPEDGIARLLNVENMLAADPYSAIAQIAQAYGVDLGRYAGQQQQPASPQEAAWQAHIAQLETRLNETSTRLQQREAQEAEAQQRMVLSEIDRFAKDKSDWQELENDILTEITGLRASINAGLMADMPAAEILAKAYERAQRNNPEVWQRKQDAEKKAAEEKRVAEAQKRVEEARKSNVVNISSPSVTGKPIASMDDDLRAAYRKANAK